jgi:hypothetical protein
VNKNGSYFKIIFISSIDRLGVVMEVECVCCDGGIELKRTLHELYFKTVKLIFNL